MFEYSLVPSGKAHPVPIVFACLSEALLLAGIIVVPMMFVQSLPERSLFNALLLAPVPMAPPAPPPPILAKKIPRAAPLRKFNPAALVSPVVVPRAVAIINEAPAVEINAAAGGIPGGIPGVASSGTGFFSDGLSVAPPPPVKAVASAPPPPPAPSAPRRITVGGDVQSALIVQQISPVYPSLARQGHIHGSVILKAVIGTDGKIKNLTAVSGHPLLVEAAMTAVRGWVYRPTILDGLPVEVNTEIEVRFGLTPSVTGRVTG